MQPDSNPDYDFFLNPPSPPKKSLFSFLTPGGDKKSRLLTLLAGGGLILVLFMALFAIFIGGPPNNTEKLVSIAQQQTEIIRVAQLGEREADSLDTKNFAATVKLSVSSSRNDLLKLLGEKGREVKNNELAAGQNAKTDEAFTAAQQTNRFDETFQATIKESLQTYQEDLREAFDASRSESERAILRQLFSSAAILADTEF